MRPTYTSPSFFFFNDTATTEIYTLSLHDALPILPGVTAPCRAISSMAISVMITTSAASPAVSFWRMTPTVPNVNVAVCPVSCRNAAARSVTIARTAPALSTLISAACARSMPGHRAIVIRREPRHPATLVAMLIVRLLAHRAGRVRCPLPERHRCQVVRPSVGTIMPCLHPEKALKYLPEIDLLCFDGQPSCLRGGDR